MRVKRFIYVASPGSDIVHVKFGNTSEGPTACKRHCAPKWKWWKGFAWRKAGMRMCTQCIAA